MQELLDYNCEEIDKKELSQEEIDEYLDELPDWNLNEDSTISKSVTFDSFAEAVEYVNSVASIAESEDHHPDIDLRYNTVYLRLTTHDLGDLTLCDFVVAAKISGLS
ncbi:MAG: 4a-hydroxytetrahydrobiopterin dehydratase [Candidatus Campbellbacteria bacterium]|nr:4a-hydroxytetrahydrobiopterin dehydratase [Candidatus Campbellbacteria bacterium]